LVSVSNLNICAPFRGMPGVEVRILLLIRRVTCFFYWRKRFVSGGNLTG